MKKLLVLLLTVFALTSCEQDSEIIGIDAEKKLPKVDVCHYDADTDTWKTISINGNALKAHLEHGDFEGSCDRKTYIPDYRFEDTLIRMGLDDVRDNYVLTSNIIGVKELLFGPNDSSDGIYLADLTGIEDFIALEKLSVDHNPVKIPDLSQNINLTSLKFVSLLQNLSTIDLSKNIKLEELILACDIPSIDLSKNTSLKKVYISWCDPDLGNEECHADGGGRISSIDLSKHTELIELGLGIGTTSLDISKNIKLIKLGLGLSNTATLDLTSNTLLKEVIISGGFENIDFSQNLLLNNLRIESTPQITSCDLSKNTSLQYLFCYGNNSLTSLNLKNGSNTSMIDYFVQENPILTCIQVDDAAWSSANWDSQSTFSEDCY